MQVIFSSLPDPDTAAILGEAQTALVKSNYYQHRGIFTTDSLMMAEKRHEGLTPLDARLAEAQKAEFGHLTDPLLYKR